MYTGINNHTTWTLLNALKEQAIDKSKEQANRIWVETTSGERLSFSDAWYQTNQIAGFLSSLGVQPKDHIALMLDNNIDFIRAWLGVNRLRAVSVLLNPELTGSFLAHQLTNADTRYIIVDKKYLPEVTKLFDQLPLLTHVIVIDIEQQQNTLQVDKVVFVDWLKWKTADPFAGQLPAPSDIACIMYTSGTTGPSKGVLMPHAHCMLYGIGAIKAFEITEQDKYYICLPLFHVNGLLMQLGASLIAGIPAVIRNRFSASEWLRDIKTHNATITHLLGALAAFILKQASSEEDKAHKLRAILNGPNISSHEKQFKSRFAIQDVISGFGMTEVNMPIWGRLGTSHPGAAGWPHTEDFEVMIADPQTDQAVSLNEVGEILVRPKVPFGFMAGYYNMPEKTIEAWRNLWFHTGDAGYQTQEGLIVFVDRIKDCIRRRGENISPVEVENALLNHSNTPHNIKELAAISAPSSIEGGEDEIILVVVPDNNFSLDEQSFGRWAAEVLPRYAQPKYVKFLDTLPKTTNGKVQRQVMKKDGINGAVTIKFEQ